MSRAVASNSIGRPSVTCARARPGVPRRELRANLFPATLHKIMTPEKIAHSALHLRPAPLATPTLSRHPKFDENRILWRQRGKKPAASHTAKSTVTVRIRTFPPRPMSASLRNPSLGRRHTTLRTPMGCGKPGVKGQSCVKPEFIGAAVTQPRVARPSPRGASRCGACALSAPPSFSREPAYSRTETTILYTWT